jgi:hypothetical protein
VKWWFRDVSGFGYLRVQAIPNAALTRAPTKPLIVMADAEMRRKLQAPTYGVWPEKSVTPATLINGTVR